MFNRVVLQSEYGEQARQASAKKAEQVNKQREALQREQKAIDEQRRLQARRNEERKKKVADSNPDDLLCRKRS